MEWFWIIFFACSAICWAAGAAFNRGLVVGARSRDKEVEALKERVENLKSEFNSNDYY